MKFKRSQTTKVYKKAKSKGKNQFPRNYRIIPERLRGDEIAFVISLIFIIGAIVVVSLDLYKNYNEEKRLTEEKMTVLRNVGFWENQIKTYPNYRDAYFSLALLNYQLEEFDKANENLEKALSLDPNFEKGKELEKLLSNFSK